ncbi:MAG: class I SAM-dependent RNA methyltransferase [Nitrospinae bacterium]|nr:class I SAM-dependent RNA methyltransferase [Nitrospinota bacterium]
MSPDLLTITIDRLAFGGAGVGRHEGKAVFVTGAFPGDTVLARVEKDKKRHAEASVAQVITPSPSRREPLCPHANSCGGCPWISLEYPAQLEWKREIVTEQLRRIGKVECFVAPVEPSPLELGYRSRVRMKMDNDGSAVYLGFRVKGLYGSMAPVTACPVSNGKVNVILGELRQYLSTVAGKVKEVYEVEIETGLPEEKGRVTLLSFGTVGEEVAPGMLSACPSVGGVSVKEGRGALKSWGAVELAMEVGLAEPLKFGPGVFSQVNPAGNLKLVEKVTRFAQLKNYETALDLYCGNGNIALPLAMGGADITGVESGIEAVRYAEINRVRLGIASARFIQGDSAHMATKMAEEGKRFDVIVLDPPRGGAKGLMPTVARLAGRRVIYVSCDPPSLARDAGDLVAQGFDLHKAVPVDMFPQTSHVEVVAVFNRLV